MGKPVQPTPAIVNDIAQRYGLKLLVYFGSYQTESLPPPD